ncbi:MAG TPA: ABC-2 family transporter protein [Candidatus Gracilibacteria bacterium]|nr:ABC-2 family transporter protein [Candidatus Gracilibacteria bacterium]
MFQLKSPQFGLKTELFSTYWNLKFNILNSAELRLSFIFQLLGMCLNNFLIVVSWIFFFQNFGSINGWSTTEFIGLQSFTAIIYGIAFSFAAGAMELPNLVNFGIFDSILLSPRNLYLAILTSKTRISALGDILFGLILLVAFFIINPIGFGASLILISLMIPATIILINFALICGCIAFFIPDSRDLSRVGFETMFAPSMYPSGLFQGGLRFFFLFIIPSIAIAGLPIEAIKNWNYLSILLVWTLAILWTAIALLVLKIGIKRYESSNLTGARN